MECKNQGKQMLKELLEYSPNPACLPRDPYLAHSTANGKVMHKKWRSLHLDYGKLSSDDIREFNDTFTSESEDENKQVKYLGSIVKDSKPKALSNLCSRADLASETLTSNVNKLPSITHLSSTICTDNKNLQSTTAILENDISRIINEVPSINESELGSSISALINQFDTTDDKVSLTCVSTLSGINNHGQISVYSGNFTPAISTPKKLCSGLNHVDKLMPSASDDVFSIQETMEYSVYTIINEEKLSPHSVNTLMDANLVRANEGVARDIHASPCKHPEPKVKPKPTKVQYPDIKPKPLSWDGQFNSDLIYSTSSSSNKIVAGPSVIVSNNGMSEVQKVSQGVSHIFHDKDLKHRSSLSDQHNHSNDINSKKQNQAQALNTNSSRPEITNTYKNIEQELHQLYKDYNHSQFSKNLKDNQYGAQRERVPYIPKLPVCSTQGINQPSPCKSKSLGDLTSEDISCNFDSKYKRINRGFLLSGNAEDTKLFSSTVHQSTDTLTEQLRKLVSYDQDDCNKPTYCEEEEWEKPKPLTRKLSSRSQSRVRNIANRARERLEASKSKQVSPLPNGVVLRNKPTTFSQPANRHSTGTYIAGYRSNFNFDSLESRGIPEGACSSQIYGHSDQFCRDHFTYQTEPCNIDEPEVYFLLRL